MNKDIEQFLQRGGLKPEKVTCIKYLCKVSDAASIKVAGNGNTTFTFEFSDGAYKGSSIITIKYKDITPIKVAYMLESCLPGNWRFGYPEADKSLLNDFQDRIDDKPIDWSKIIN